MCVCSVYPVTIKRKQMSGCIPLEGSSLFKHGSRGHTGAIFQLMMVVNKHYDHGQWLMW